MEGQLRPRERMQALVQRLLGTEEDHRAGKLPASRKRLQLRLDFTGCQDLRRDLEPQTRNFLDIDSNSGEM
jgi:hypothetical protein